MRSLSNLELQTVGGGAEVQTVVISKKKMTDQEKKEYDEAYLQGIKDAAEFFGKG